MALSKKKKIWISVTAAITAIVLITVTVVLCLLFVQEKYDLDLDYLLDKGKVVFEDEFNGNGINQDILIDGEKVNRNVWNITDTVVDTRDPANHKTTNIRRGAYWDMSQVGVSDGAMTITTEKKSDGRYYTAGLTTAMDKVTPGATKGYEHKYGYYEVRAILPKGYGQWAAFWMMSDEFSRNEASGHNNGAEIDVFEAPSYPKTVVQQAVHKGGYADKHTSTFNSRWMSQKLGDIYDSYHTYGLYWDQDIYKFYVDRKCVWTSSYNKDVSRVPQWLFLSIEIAGQPVEKMDVDKNGNLLPTLGDNPWIFSGGKNPDANPEGWKSEFKIDYVKIWDAPSDIIAVSQGKK